VDLKRIHVPQARALYQADYALIRPDQIVAWRGDCAEQAGQALDRILGAAVADASALAVARLS
jgi:hypothetical protein